MSGRAYPNRVLALMVSGIAYFLVAGISFPVLPRLAKDGIGGSTTDIGLAFGVFALGMLFVRPIAGFWSYRYGLRALMIVNALGISSVQLLHVPAAETGTLWILLLVRVGTGAFKSPTYLAQATAVTELPPEQHRDCVFATFSVAIFVGFALGTILGEWILLNHGFTWTFLMALRAAGAAASTAVTLPETRPVAALSIQSPG